MKSSQINFYITIQDAKKIDEYIQKSDMLILVQPVKYNKLEITGSILNAIHNNQEIQSIKYIVRKKDIEQVKLKYIPQQNYYLIDFDSSPVIEIWYHAKEKSIHRGRIYYIKDSLDSASKTEFSKSPEFLETANQFFKWVRKNFKNTKLSGYEGYLVSEQAAQWTKETGGELVLQ